MRGRGQAKPRVIAGRFSRKERQFHRAKIDLEDAALTDQTRTRYYLALRKIIKYVERATPEDQLDSLLCLWIKKMWKTGEPLLTVGDALSALHFYQPWTKRRIPHSWKLFAVWRRVELPSRAPPLTWTLVTALAGYEWHLGNYEMAVVLLVAFHCLLRTGEFLSLTANDVSLGPISGVISLKGTKTGVRNNSNEVVSVTCPLVLEFLRFLVLARRDLGLTALPFWSSSPHQFRCRFRELCNLLGVSEHNFRPYSLRRGGATAYFQATHSMEAALIRGRWGSSRVARLYISDGLSYIPEIKMSRHTSGFIAKYNIEKLSQ